MARPGSNHGAARTTPLESSSRTRRFRLIAASLLSLGMVGGTAWMLWHQSRPMVSPVTEVEVQGVFRHLTGAEVEHSITPYLADGFWLLDVNAMGESLQALPWVKSVDVRRVWPSKVILDVTEQQAVVRWLPGGFLNNEGQHFQPEGEADAGYVSDMVELEGPEGSERKVFDQLARLDGVLAKNEMSLRRLSTDARRSWRLVLANGIELNMGRADLEARLQRFIVVYHQVLKQRLNEVAGVDLRYSNGVAVSWKIAPQAVMTEG